VIHFITKLHEEGCKSFAFHVKPEIFIALGIGAWYLYGILRGAGGALLPPDKDVRDFPSLPVDLPPDFEISIFAGDVENARVLIFDPRGRIIVSQTKSGSIIALPDENGDGKADTILTVVDGLNKPHGMFFHCIAGGCNLYIAEEDKVSVYPYDAENARVVGSGKVLFALPSGGNHTTRTIASYEEDGKTRMFISIGSSCNVCNEEDNRRAKIFTANLDGTDMREFARGLRNSVFMTLHPETGELWATDMGRDLLGDDTPPDEMNIVLEDKNYGWPICYGKNIHDTEFDKNVYIRAPCQDPFEVSSFLDIPAHSAPLGLAFIPEQGFPSAYRGDLLVAYHGSWNRTEPTGYKIVHVDLDKEGNLKGGQSTVSDFATGWLTEDGVLGRPVDILVHPKEGSIFVSDDKAGVVYKISYNGYVDPIIKDKPKEEAPGRCIRAGCSGTICVDEKDEPIITTCEFRPEYACYREAICERQENEECGWTQTTELTECLVEEKGKNN